MENAQARKRADQGLASPACAALPPINQASCVDRDATSLPRLIQGGMGVGVSSWPLAHQVAALGQLGVVSGTALDTILIRRLSEGDPGGHLRRAMAAFPAQDVARDVLDAYFRPRHTSATAAPMTVSDRPRHKAPDPRPRYPLAPLMAATLTPRRQWLVILANFVEVYLAREGHAGVVGINYLHKIRPPLLASLYGAMLAGVDVVLMGAGIPGDIPDALDQLSRHSLARVALDVAGAGDRQVTTAFDPAALWAGQARGGMPRVRRPMFLAIIASASLARALIKKAPGGIDGFVVEAPIAGGHNAPPRGAPQRSPRGEPIYTRRDEVDPTQMASLGVPFWLAGGYASRQRYLTARRRGAHGVQVGTAFAFCEESGLDPQLRRALLERLRRGEEDVFTDPAASPTGFPFKVAAMDQTLSQQAVYDHRPRQCDLGYLRQSCPDPDFTSIYRGAA